MKKTLLLACALVTLSACTNQLNTQLQSLQDYQVEWIGERPLIDNSMLTFTLGEQNSVSGLAGCNTWSANYQLNGATLRLDAISSTRKRCAPALMEQEQRFLAALAHVQHWEFVENQQLLLWPEQGEPIKLWPIEQPPQH